MKIMEGEFKGIYRAYVARNTDPLEMGRVQVRIPFLHGIVGNDFSAIKDKDLPYAMPCFPVASYDSGMCLIPEVGSIVFVFFRVVSTESVSVCNESICLVYTESSLMEKISLFFNESCCDCMSIVSVVLPLAISKSLSYLCNPDMPPLLFAKFIAKHTEVRNNVNIGKTLFKTLVFVFCAKLVIFCCKWHDIYHKDI